MKNIHIQFCRLVEYSIFAGSGVDISDKTGQKALNMEQVEMLVGDNRVFGKNTIIAKINDKYTDPILLSSRVFNIC